MVDHKSRARTINNGIVKLWKIARRLLESFLLAIEKFTRLSSISWLSQQPTRSMRRWNFIVNKTSRELKYKLKKKLYHNFIVHNRLTILATWTSNERNFFSFELDSEWNWISSCSSDLAKEWGFLWFLHLYDPGRWWWLTLIIYYQFNAPFVNDNGERTA